MGHNHFAIEESESILESLALGSRKSEIARRIGRNRSSVGREIKRNSIDRKCSSNKANHCILKEKRNVELT